MSVSTAFTSQQKVSFWQRLTSTRVGGPETAGLQWARRQSPRAHSSWVAPEVLRGASRSQGRKGPARWGQEGWCWHHRQECPGPPGWGGQDAAAGTRQQALSFPPPQLLRNAAPSSLAAARGGHLPPVEGVLGLGLIQIRSRFTGATSSGYKGPR